MYLKFDHCFVPRYLIIARFYNTFVKTFSTVSRKSVRKMKYFYQRKNALNGFKLKLFFSEKKASKAFSFLARTDTVKNERLVVLVSELE